MTEDVADGSNQYFDKGTKSTTPPPAPSAPTELEIARSRERYFHTLLDNTIDIVSFFDANGASEFVTSAVTRVLGYTPGEWMAMGDILELIHPDDRAMAAEQAFLLRTRAISRSRCVCRVRHQDGSYRWMEMLGIDLREDPAARGFLGILRDITKRKVAEEALEAGRQILEEAQAVAKIGSWLYDYREPLKLVWSAETYRMFGVDPSEPMTRQRFFSLIHPEDVATVEARGENELVPYSLEHRVVRTDGQIIWVHERARVERDPVTGARVRMVGTVQDITERKQIEEQLRHSQKMEAIGRLAGGVAHDFNNLLALILAQCEWVQKNIGVDHPLQPELGEIALASARGAALTRQLLAFSRRQHTSARLLRLDAIVAETERLLRRLLGEHIAIEVTLAAEGDAVLADRGNLEQVLLNLAVNARDAMPNGGKLHISTRSEEVTSPRLLPTGLLPVGMYTALSVSDEGGGIDPRARAHLFEPFFTTKAIGEGTGLGLATVFGIVQEANGGIAVTSEMGKGTTFDVLLPRIAELGPVEVDAERASGKTLPRGTETILLVEDDVSLRAVLRRTLGALGYAVLAAADGAEAMNICATLIAPIDLLLTDLVMPGRDGRATADLLSKERPSMKTVLMSGYAEPAILPRGSGGPPILAKPFTEHELATTVRRTLDS